ncbi:ABC transporter ATP-binding protein [Thermococcus nautili]|uniref:energy-coupling factor ABC transporter ATP-binding protein n=1 Tax=Thermococcus nautili TaxID=195522 RepID=UPI0025574A7C|nr:ATP-binding cassette domain-containing protein [Thermococcus nautili]CAI1491893.1 ABC transporter ATP-binding protein [Thermococcus nautili]
MIEMRNVHFSYPGREVLKGITLTVERGELFGLLGPNGAGKSTLLLHLNGILRPKRGKVLVDGIEPAKNPREVRKKVGIVFQDPNDQLFSPTVFEDVAFGPYNLGLRGEELRERVLWALKKVGMRNYADRETKELSFGEKKRIAIATVLAMKPEVVVFDEPFANLDFRGKSLMRKLITELKNEGKTVILASHEADYLSLCDRIALIDGGRVVTVGTPEEILGNPELLRKHNLDVPPLVELFLSLGLPIPKDPEDARRKIMEALKNSGPSRFGNARNVP